MASVGRLVAARDAMTLATARNAAARSYTVSGTVSPARDGQLVAIASRRSDGSYAGLGTAHTDAVGRWSYRHTFTTVGTRTVRARSAATTRNAAGSISVSLAVG